MKRTDLAWLAGFFDGEGCIYLHHPTKVNYSLVIQVASTDKWILGWFSLAFGGSIRVSNFNKKSWKQQWQWSTSCQKAEATLKVLLPYLKLKKAQAELALEFQKSRSFKRGLNAVNEAELILREAYYQELKFSKR